MGIKDDETEGEKEGLLAQISVDLERQLGFTEYFCDNVLFWSMSAEVYEPMH